MRSNTGTGTAPQDGRGIARLVRGKRPRARAEMGADLVASGWTQAQASRIVVTHPGYVSQAVRERKNGKNGNGHAHHAHAAADIDQVITDIGADRVLDALDRMTKPSNSNI